MNPYILLVKQAIENYIKEKKIIFLNRPLRIIEKWLTDAKTRGIVGLKLKPIKELYKERLLLYKKYADITINCFRKSNREIIQEIIKKLK